ncbi:MAG: hypothetical protein ABIG66_02655 [Candidatus Kerfeldbacteria bacterium]
MGFVVEPYSLFLCFELQDIEKAKALLPKGFSMVKAKVHEGDAPKYYGIIGSFNAHTSGFWGTRQETYVIAEDEATGLMTWVIIGIESNSISFEPKDGLQGSNADDAVVTQDANGTIIVDIERNDKSGRLELLCETKKGEWKNLDERLWLEGNLSVTYGGELAETCCKPFSLTFDPEEVEKGLVLPMEDLDIRTGTLIPDFFKQRPSQVVTFPYSQHFISDSPISPKLIKNKKELIAAHKRLGDLSEYEAFSVQTMKVGLAISIVMSSIISTTAISLLILHFWLRH